MAAGQDFTCALDSSSQVRCPVHSHVFSSLLLAWRRHTRSGCEIKSFSRRSNMPMQCQVWVWGRGDNGELGMDGSMNERSTPDLLPDQPRSRSLSCESSRSSKRSSTRPSQSQNHSQSTVCGSPGEQHTAFLTENITIALTSGSALSAVRMSQYTVQGYEWKSRSRPLAPSTVSSTVPLPRSPEADPSWNMAERRSVSAHRPSKRHETPIKGDSVLRQTLTPETLVEARMCVRVCVCVCVCVCAGRGLAGVSVVESRCIRSVGMRVEELVPRRGIFAP